MADNIEAILLRLGLDASGFTKGARQGRKEIDLMEKGVGSLRSQVAGLAGQFAAGLGIAVLAREAIQFAEAVTKVHEQTGLAISSVQFLRLAADQTGTSVDSLAGLVGKMQRQLVEASNNTKLAAELEDIGVKVADLRTMRPEDQLQSIAQSIAAIQDPAERTAAAVLAFGKSGAEAIPELVALAEKSDELTEAFQRTGGAVSDENIAQVEAMGDAMGQVKTAVTSLATELLGTAAPALTSFLQTVTETVAGLRLLDGEGDNAAVNLDNKIRDAHETLKQMEETVSGQRWNPFASYTDDDITKQRALVEGLEDEYNAMQNLGMAGALRARQNKEFQSLMAANIQDGLVTLTTGLESDLAIRAHFGELRYEQDTALEERLFQMREAARQRELEAVMEERQREADFVTTLQAEVDSNVQSGVEAASDLKITTWQQDTESIAGLLQDQTEGVARHSKAMFEVNKAAGIANAIISTAQGIARAFADWPFPVSAGIAAVVAASGAAQVAAISSAKFGQKTAPSQAASPATPTAPAQGAGGGGGGGIMRVEGMSPDSLFTGKTIRKVAGELLEYQKNGGQVVFAE